MVSFSSFLLSIAFLQALFLSDKRLEKRMKRFLAVQDKKGLGRKKFDLLVQMQLYKQTIRDKVLTKQKNEKLGEELARAGLPLRPEEFVMLQWISMFLGGGLLLLVSGKLLLLPIGLAAGYLLPKRWVAVKQRSRMQAFNDGLQDMLTTVIGSLRAGFSFAQALRTVVDESESPMKEEIETVLRDMQYGTSMEDALNEWKERMPSEDLDLMVQAILIQRQVGGNLAAVLETIVHTIRDRNKIQRQVRTLTAQGRMSGLVIGLLPVVLSAILFMIDPSYIGSLFRHPIGIALVAAGALSSLIGFMLIRKLTSIEV